jgi:hypothetical protein
LASYRSDAKTESDAGSTNGGLSQVVESNAGSVYGGPTEAVEDDAGSVEKYGANPSTTNPRSSLPKVVDDMWPQEVPFLSMMEYWEELLKQANKDRGSAFTYKAPPLAVTGQGRAGLVRMHNNGRCISLFEDEHAYGVAMSQGRGLEDGEVVEISLRDRGADNNYLLVGHKEGHSIVYLSEASQKTLNDIHNFNYTTALLTETEDEEELKKFYRALICDIGNSFITAANAKNPLVTKDLDFISSLKTFLDPEENSPSIEYLKSGLSNILTNQSKVFEDVDIKAFNKLTQDARSQFIRSFSVEELESNIGQEGVKRARLIASSKSRADVTAITSANINPHSMNPEAFKGIEMKDSSGSVAASDYRNRVAEVLKECPLLVGASESPTIYTSRTNPYHVSVTVNGKFSWIHVPDTNVYLAVDTDGKIETSKVRLKTKDENGVDKYTTVVPFERSDQFDGNTGKAWDLAKKGVNGLFSLATLGVFSPMAVKGDALASHFGEYTAKHIREQVKKMVVTTTVLDGDNKGQSFAVFADPDKGHNYLQRVEFNTKDYVEQVKKASAQEAEKMEAIKSVAKALQQFHGGTDTIAEEHLKFSRGPRDVSSAAEPDDRSTVSGYSSDEDAKAHHHQEGLWESRTRRGSVGSTRSTSHIK